MSGIFMFNGLSTVFGTLVIAGTAGMFASSFTIVRFGSNYGFFVTPSKLFGLFYHWRD